MTGSRKKVLIAVVVIAAVVVAGIIGLLRLNSMAQQGVEEIPDTIVLRMTDIENKVTASGNFASADPVSVGSNALGGEVEEVFVAEGEKVYAGDVLARLKTSDLERSIEDMRSAVADLSRGDRQKLEAAQRAVDEAQSQYDSDNFWTQTDINNAQNALNLAKSAVTNFVPDPAATDEENALQLEQLQQAVIGAQTALDQAKRVRESTLRAGSSRLTEAQAQLDALRGVDSARQSRTQLESLNEELANAYIISPITGVITRVLTEAGKSAMGDMFFIEDTESLQIKASVAEFDVIKIEEGMMAHIRSNATGSIIYDGVVDFVAPVASDLSGNFEVRVMLLGNSGQLKPGMTATVEIIIEAKQDVFAVPIDAVITKPDGTKAVVIFENMARRELTVKTGMETDFYIEIISDELKDGLLILADPMGLNVRFSGFGPMMMGGQAVGAGPVHSEGTVTYSVEN